MVIGGNGGSRPRLSRKLAQGIQSDEEAMALVDRVVDWFKAQNRRGRLGKFVDEMGFEAFCAEILSDEEDAARSEK